MDCQQDFTYEVLEQVIQLIAKYAISKVQLEQIDFSTLIKIASQKPEAIHLTSSNFDGSILEIDNSVLTHNICMKKVSEYVYLQIDSYVTQQLLRYCTYSKIDIIKTVLAIDIDKNTVQVSYLIDKVACQLYYESKYSLGWQLYSGNKQVMDCSLIKKQNLNYQEDENYRLTIVDSEQMDINNKVLLAEHLQYELKARLSDDDNHIYLSLDDYADTAEIEQIANSFLESIGDNISVYLLSQEDDNGNTYEGDSKCSVKFGSQIKQIYNWYFDNFVEGERGLEFESEIQALRALRFQQSCNSTHQIDFSNGVKVSKSVVVEQNIVDLHPTVICLSICSEKQKYVRYDQQQLICVECLKLYLCQLVEAIKNGSSYSDLKIVENQRLPYLMMSIFHCKKLQQIGMDFVKSIALSCHSLYNKQVCPNHTTKLCLFDGQQHFCPVCQSVSCDVCGEFHDGRCISPMICGCGTIQLYEESEHCPNCYQKFQPMKRCPQCGLRVLKSEGCNHITCICGFEFCYLCGGGYHEDHFTEHHPQYGDSDQ